MDMFTKFYGVDWVLFLLVVVHLWMLGHKMRAAFLVGVLASATGFVLGLIIMSAGTLTMNVVFAILHLRAYLRWKQIDQDSLAESVEQVTIGIKDEHRTEV